LKGTGGADTCSAGMTKESDDPDSSYGENLQLIAHMSAINARCAAAIARTRRLRVRSAALQERATHLLEQYRVPHTSPLRATERIFNGICPWQSLKALSTGAAGRVMAREADTLHTCLDRLVELVELAPQVPQEDRVRVERTIQLVSRALQAVARTRQQTENEAHLKEAAEVATLCWWIDEAVRMADLRVGKNNGPR